MIEDSQQFHLKVLIVDDNFETASTLAAFFSKLGCDSKMAITGQEGMSTARQFSPDLAFIDISLPDMSGLQVGLKMREVFGSDIVLAAFTAHGSSADKLESSNAGFDFHVTKPADVDNLIEVARNAASRFSRIQPKSLSSER